MADSSPQDRKPLVEGEVVPDESPPQTVRCAAEVATGKVELDVEDGPDTEGGSAISDEELESWLDWFPL